MSRDPLPRHLLAIAFALVLAACADPGAGESSSEASGAGGAPRRAAPGANAPPGSPSESGAPDEAADRANEGAKASPADACASHGVERCPFCFPELIDALGFCGGHGVPEAICTRCRDDLDATFAAVGDWCAGHDLPESQCEVCNPGTLARWTPDEAAASWVALVGVDAPGAPGADPSPTARASLPTGDSPDVPCTAHAITGCPFCFPELIDALGFCAGHGVPEAICTRCRDDLDETFAAVGDWCAGHDLPESQCEACNPGTLARWTKEAAGASWEEFVEAAKPELASLDPAEREATLAALLASDVEIAPVDEPRSSRAPSPTCATGRSVVRLANQTVAERIGLRVEPVRRVALRRELEVPATIGYDERRFAHLAPRAAGTIVELACELGASVREGRTLAVLDCADLGSAKAEHLSALARVELWTRNHAREQALLERSISTEREALEAETRLTESRIAARAAERRLANLGLTPAEIAVVARTEDTSSLLELRAPFDGLVVELDATLGETATTGTPLVAIADTRTMWARLAVDPAEIASVALGQRVRVELEGRRGEPLDGLVTWISTRVDARTRTIEVRAELPDPDGIARAGSFARARIATHDGAEALVVPREAVQWEGCCNVVFVARSATEFRPRPLQLGAEVGEHYEVLAGLDGDERIVTQGSFLLKTELRKSSIGAGCCEVDHLGK